MKTRLLATGLLLALSSVALAHAPPGHRGLDIDQLEILLDLDSYQKSEVQRILNERRDAMRAKREERRNAHTPPTVDERKQERVAAQKATRDQLAQVLNAQQMKKFDVLSERPKRLRRAQPQKQ